MSGFLFSLWERTAELGGIIHENDEHQIIGVTFKSEEDAAGFVKYACNPDMWIDALNHRAILNKNAREVHINWPPPYIKFREKQ